MNTNRPEIISYSKIHPVPGKEIVVNEKETLSQFPIKRIYWIRYESAADSYSSHAQRTLHQVIIPVSGEIHISLENQAGDTYQYTLNDPGQGLYIPPLYWKQIKYSTPCILLCLVSDIYDENDYIRDYDTFKASETK